MDFSKPRPVPSKAALRVLYQLAYISSGTLVGAAALCAEERRRRTQIVQKIADNARRIRASPRYNHHAAAPAFRIDGAGLDPLAMSRRTFTRSDLENARESEGDLAPWLPTAVDDGYAYLEKRRRARLVDDAAMSKHTPIEPGLQSPDKVVSNIMNQEKIVGDAAKVISLVAQIPTSSRSFRVRSRSDKGDAKFIRMWRQTRNFDHVLKEYDKVERDMAAGARSENAQRYLTRSKLWLLIESGKFESALSLLQTRGAPHYDQTHRLMLKALIHAKQTQWSKVTESLDLINLHDLQRDHQIAQHLMHQIVSCHAESRDCAQAWKFIEMCEQKYVYRPDEETAVVFMLAMVSQDRFDLIPAWLRHLRRVDASLSLSGSHAARLLSRYHKIYSPRASTISGLCQNLMRDAPELRGTFYDNLIQNAVSRDVRETDEISLDDISNEFCMMTADDIGENTAKKTPADEVLVKPRGRSRAERVEKEGKFLRKVHANMYTAMSVRDYSKVLELYTNTLGRDGMPISMKALKLALRASLRLHDWSSIRAKEILQQAHNAGISPAICQHIILISRLYSQAHVEDRKLDEQHIRESIAAYHEFVLAHDQLPNSQVWFAAADILIKTKRPGLALLLLKDMYAKYPDRLRDLTNPRLAILLRCFVATRHQQGIEWVCKVIRSQNIHVTFRFLRIFHILLQPWLDNTASSVGFADSSDLLVRSKLYDLYRGCVDLRRRQEKELYRKGQELVNILVECVKHERRSALPGAQIAELDEDLFGTFEEPSILDQEGDFRQETGPPRPQSSPKMSSDDYAKLRTTLRHELNLDEPVGPHKRAYETKSWKLRYRWFYDRDIILQDGSIAAFQFYCAENQDELESARLEANALYKSRPGVKILVFAGKSHEKRTKIE